MKKCSYEDYMIEYLMEEFGIENILSDPFYEAKEGVYKDNYYMRDHLQNIYIKPLLDSSKNRDAVIDFVAAYMDEHEAQLSTNGPVYSFTFSDKEVSTIYGMINGSINIDTPKLDNELLLKIYNGMVDETYGGKISQFMTGWVTNAPHKLVLVAMIIESVQKGYEDILECAEYMFAFTEYPILYRKSWPLGVKKDLMDYTIERLSNKFVVRNVKNLKELLKYDANASVEGLRDKLKEGYDNMYLDFMYRIRNQMRNKFVNIANAYFIYDKIGATQHTTQSEFDDGSLVDQSGYTSIMTQTIDNTVDKFSTGSINNTIIKACAEGNKADASILKDYINQIISSKNNRLPKLVEDIITAYFNRNPTSPSVGNKEFIVFGLSLYKSIGTSGDPIYQEIKAIIALWMNDIINIKESYSSGGTINNYTRAIFNYIIFMIAHYN